MFVHLHNHSDYSLLDGLAKTNQLVETAAEMNMPAVALTDHGNMFGILEFYTNAKNAGIKPIIGCELYITPDGRKVKKASKQGGVRYHLLLFAKDDLGYRNLSKLVSEAYVSGFYYKPRIDKELLQKYHEGIICTSGCLKGEIPQLLVQNSFDAARESLEFYRNLFGDDFYLEIQRHGIEDQEKIIPHILQFGQDYDIKVIATNDIHYLKREHAQAHDILLCVGTQAKVDAVDRMRFHGPEFYFKSEAEMQEIFDDCPDTLSNTLEIAEKCNVDIKLGEQHYPVFDIQDEPDMSAEEYLRQITMEGFRERYGDNPPDEAVRRVENELKVIEQTGFSNYFLVVWDFVKWAKDNEVPVGPGRGSAAGCTVSYCLGITNLDPTRYGLIFERFLNPERISPPDIDIDFADDRREDVINFVRDKYGDDCVCRITTFGKMAAKSVVRDVARVLDISIPEVNRIAKLIPEGPKVKLTKALKEVKELRELIDSDTRYQKLMENALIMEGTVRNSGTHAAGVVICPGKTVDYIPVYKMGGEGEEYTQFDMNWIDKLGLLKMDFLGLQTLTELEMTKRSLAEKGIQVDLDNIDMEDEKVYRFLGEGHTIGVFQFESSGMRENLAKLKPKRIEDLLAMAALYRPGPMANIPTYIACSHGKQRPTYLHPRLEPILRETHGVIIYQEQVMKTAVELAGFTLGKADILRKAMGKKKEKMMAELKPQFIEGCANNDIEEKTADKIWEQLLEFAKYGFVKAHAAAYAVIAYQCGYLKTYFAADYLASCLTVRRRNPTMMLKLLAECRKLGIRVLPPDINDSKAVFKATDQGIRFGFCAIKGVGDAAVRAITKAQEEHGPFQTIHDFLTHVDLHTANKKVHENLVQAGAFDSLGESRAKLFASLPSSIAYAQAMQDERERGQTTLFGGGGGVNLESFLPPPTIKDTEPWDLTELLSREKEMLGYYITSHPLKHFEKDIEGLATFKLADKDEFHGGMRIRCCGVISELAIKTSRAGNKWAIMKVEDLTGMIECRILGQAFDTYTPLLADDNLVAIVGTIDRIDNDAEPTLRIDDMIPLKEAAQRWGYAIHLELKKEEVTINRLNSLEQTFSRYPGQNAIYIDYRGNGRGNKIFEVTTHRIRLEKEVINRLKTIVGNEQVHVTYKPI